MAAEVIALLHGLLSAPETHTAQSWSEAVQRVSKNWLLSEELSLAHIELCGIISIWGLNFMVNYISHEATSTMKYETKSWFDHHT